VHQEEEVGEAAEVVVMVGVVGAQEVEKVVHRDMVELLHMGVARITMPRQLVEEEEKAPVVVQRVEPDLVPGLAMVPALVRVVRHQPLPGMGMPMLMVMVGVKAKVLVPMELAEKGRGRAAAKEVVRVA
jgi:hypothetical protein